MLVIKVIITAVVFAKYLNQKNNHIKIIAPIAKIIIVTILNK
jgi:hypothetical protein